MSKAEQRSVKGRGEKCQSIIKHLNGNDIFLKQSRGGATVTELQGINLMLPHPAHREAATANVGCKFSVIR